MKISVDNLDGLGAQDYSGWISAAGPLKVQRSLNSPSTCDCLLDLNAAQLKRPIRRGRVIVTRADGFVLFTGYVANEPELIYAGSGVSGAVYRVALHGISDDWLLDRRGVPLSGAGLDETGAAALRTLTDRVGAGVFTVGAAGGVRKIGIFGPEPNKSWSENAGAIAGSVCAAYRVLGAVLDLRPAGTVVHSLNDGDGSLQLAGFQVSQTRELANDVTVSGELEPAAYISESFMGDGTTSVFRSTEVPFRNGSSHGFAGHSSQLVSESFDNGTIDPRIWAVYDPGSHISVNARGLRLSGGNAIDGQTRISAIDLVEIGGSIVLEVGSVLLEAGSNGVLCGLYTGDVSRSSCFAGYNVRESDGASVVVPLINGVESGVAYTLQSGHTYTLRVRVHCVEMQRVRQIFYAMIEGSVRTFGGGTVDAAVNLVFDLLDTGASSNTPAVILYEGTVENAPAICSFAPVNSLQLVGNVGYCTVTQTGSAWVTKVNASGVRSTQRAGTTGEGVDCNISPSGTVTFFAGRLPFAGELVTLSYRSSQRAIARIEDPANVAAEAAGGFPGTSQWRGKVVRPVARSTPDCESVAQALLSVASDRAATMSGTYVSVVSEDMWPGDVLSVSRAGEVVSTLVRSVAIHDGMAEPEYVTYRVAFASEWAEGLGIKVSEAVATDVILPQVAQPGTGVFLRNLPGLTLLSASAVSLQIDTGTAPPAGGGFEVRRRDGPFGTGVDQDLVLRSPARSFSIPREAQVERYYVRMYDGSTPPAYSRLSSAIFTDISVG